MTVTDNVIIWSGWTANGAAYRLLGDSRSISSRSRLYGTRTSYTPKRLVTHCEGTTTSDASRGVTNTHCIAYDMEVAYDGEEQCNVGNDILCVTVKCSCKCFTRVITRAETHIEGVECVTKTTNEEIARATISAFIEHGPAFIYGHNVFLFDNVVLALSFADDDPLTKFFVPITDSVGVGSSQVGFMIALPGINNVDTYRYIRQAMATEFQRFSLECLAIQLELDVRKVDSSDLQFNSLWYTSSHTNRHRMIKYNMADCDTNECLLNKLAIIPQICTICYAASATIEDVCLYRTGAMAASALARSAMLIRNFKFELVPGYKLRPVRASVTQKPKDGMPKTGLLGIDFNYGKK